MFKKLIIIAAVVMVGSVVFMPQITESLAKTALKPENQAKEWAPGAAYKAATINLRFFRFKTAAAILERSMQAWPDEDWIPDARYQHALAYEKMEKGEEAIKLYNAFQAKHPTHRWADQAGKRVINIQANLP